ncbi:hypothetical protein COCNU_contig69386541G000010 [Cocos nucifera]|nr:hypothetical protein [Cocos nucifera]
MSTLLNGLVLLEGCGKDVLYRHKLLCALLKAVVHAQLLWVYKPCRDGPSFSYIFYADDILLVARATVKDSPCLKAILETYCNISGQAINFQISQITFSPSVAGRMKSAIGAIFQIPEKRGSWKYLGVPIAATKLAVSDFTYILEGIIAKMESWKWRNLFFAGRLTLLQSVLFSTPTYCLSSVNVPTEEEFRAFLWGHPVDDKGIHLPSWDHVRTPKDQGGLRLISLRMRKQALITKLAAQLVLTPHSLWAQIVRAKYKFKGSWYSYNKPAKCCDIWAKIVAYGTNIRFHFVYALGSGENIDVLQDPWIPTIPLNHWPTYKNMEGDLNNMKVKQVMSDAHKWDAEIIKTMFSEELTRMIFKVHVAHIWKVARFSCLEDWNQPCVFERHHAGIYKSSELFFR